MATHNPPILTLAGAQTALSASIQRAQAISVPMNVAVVDASLHLLAFARMDGAKLTSVDIAVNKAFTAAGHRVPTSSYKDKVVPGSAVWGINWTNGGRFSTIGGGVPIVKDGVVVGAVGCSTGTPAQDEDVATAGVEAVVKSFAPKAKL
ncbi:DUF336-domain-containing protein [Bimuria novae-zelandiae CBS 107.79]|uniref:DUF336-domain-containing protein n=1 Tax=Bimuria novae-zelandiae CBS 107.79 TaxID=1447943 RepID=A0A6A5VJP9_9PLEO|nr:DUF336-domain-containing protein [Bimuria novae-zelandiae CBS 107.79]